MNIQVAILDNDKVFLKLLETVLEDQFIVKATSDTNEFMKLVKEPAVLIVDWFLDYGITGNKVVEKIRKENPICHVIFISSLASKEILLETINEGWGCYFIEKDKTDFTQVLIKKIQDAKTLLRAKISRSNEIEQREELLKEKINNTLKALEENSNGRCY